VLKKEKMSGSMIEYGLYNKQFVNIERFKTFLEFVRSIELFLMCFLKF